MRKFYIMMFLLLGAGIVFSSCATRKMLKKAAKMEETGLYPEAAELYYQVLVRKKDNIDAIAGLKRAGEFTLGRKLSDFNRAYNEQKNKEAVHYYLDAQAYHERVKKVGIELNFPSFYTDYYNEVKDIYLQDKYFEAMNYLQNEAFTQAENALREIVRIQPNYRDAKDQLNIAIYEPVYREALNLMDNGKFRDAYFRFQNIISNMGSYKDVHDLQREALDKGSVTIALSAVKNSSSKSSIETNIENEIINSIQSLNNPFIKLVDQTKSQSGVAARNAREQSSIRFAAPDATLFCEINSFNYDAGRLKETNQRGYLKKRVKYKNPETDKTEYRTEYDKVDYKEFQMSRSVQMTISFRLINERSGEILSSGTRNINSVDEIHYATYGGNHNNLVPGYWKSKSSNSDEDVIRDNRRDVRALQELLSGRTQIKTYESLAKEVFTNSSGFVAAEVNKFVLEN
jgi:hypothetical protein